MISVKYQLEPFFPVFFTQRNISFKITGTKDEINCLLFLIMSLIQNL